MIRAALMNVCGSVGLPTALLAVRATSGSPWITVITFHRALRHEDLGELDPGVVDVTPDALDRHVAYMKRWFDVVGLDDFFAFRSGGKLPKNPLMITFDDGYLDNYEVALPILKKHGVPATFFVATDYVDRRKLFWWDEISIVFQRTRRAEITLEYPFVHELSCIDDAHREESHKWVLDVVKNHFDLDLDRFLEGLRAASGVAFAPGEERAIADRHLMTWDHVRDLRRQGMAVQSHTHTHRVLQTLAPAALERELVVSREILERVLGEPVRAISYPVGKPLHLFPEIRLAVKRAGYELGFSNTTGTNHRWDFDPLDARRLATDVDAPDAYFHSMLAMPYIVPLEP